MPSGAVDALLVSSQTIGRRQPWAPRCERFSARGACQRSGIPSPIDARSATKSDVHRSRCHRTANRPLGRPPSPSPPNNPPLHPLGPPGRRKRRSRPSRRHYARHDDPGPDQCTARVTTPARRHRQGRHRQDHGRRRPGARPGRRGHEVLLCEVEGRQGIARCSTSPPLPYAERRIAVGPGGGEVFALAVDAEAALLEYLDMFYKLGRAGKVLDRFGAIDFATTIAPGLRDVLLTGKVYEATRRRRDGARARRPHRRTTPWSWTRRRPAGSRASSTSTPRSPAWPRSARSATRPTRSCGCCIRSTAVHVVTLLEEMPVQETLDALAELRRTSCRVGAHRGQPVREPACSTAAELGAAAAGKLDAPRSRPPRRRPGSRPTSRLVRACSTEARDHAERVGARTRAARPASRGGPARPYELPCVADGIDLGSAVRLADDLRSAGDRLMARRTRAARRSAASSPGATVSRGSGR